MNDQENIDETERKDGQTQLKGSNRGLLSGKYIASRVNNIIIYYRPPNILKQ